MDNGIPVADDAVLEQDPFTIRPPGIDQGQVVNRHVASDGDLRRVAEDAVSSYDHPPPAAPEYSFVDDAPQQDTQGSRKGDQEEGQDLVNEEMEKSLVADREVLVFPVRGGAVVGQNRTHGPGFPSC